MGVPYTYSALGVSTAQHSTAPQDIPGHPTQQWQPQSSKTSLTPTRPTPPPSPAGTSPSLPPRNTPSALTCMDARIDPAAAYGIPLGDAHIIRNAGASAKDALRSLIISEQLLGTQEILLLKHTGCGMLTFGNEDAVGLVRGNLGDAGVDELAAFGGDFLPFADLETAVRKDVEYLKQNKAIPDSVAISGWVYQVEDGKVKHII
ncbi:Uncharacterized protein LHYA1_G002591 [Lachnellula hyalina]|uniref:Carbonic anhydrase n=1 Tax=Lachnellula hyalina TaxID=1316788 RepID=A0A8H8U2G2_9HELO|nr:Uncharacterized protein LHYA1_G002591 [Lachnellula hyalina]TVY28061.1 Uncharacterized protein LHYA1_G002591 [Lachnellula hyalina]